MIRERWGQVTGQFDLDHFAPRIHAPAHPPMYENLVYACHTCNLRKRDEELPDIRLTAEHVRVYEDGRMVALTPAADRTIRLLYLNTPQSIEWRRLWIRTVQLAEEHDRGLLRQLMGFPEDLPDLSQLRAPSNSRPDGAAQSHYAKRQRGELPETYLF